MRIPNRIRYINKRLINKVVLSLAGKPHAGIAILTHRGRISGREYQIPIMLAPISGGFVFALTYGPQVDWYKNIKANGWGRVRWRGVEYELSSPCQIRMEDGQRLFTPFKSMVLRVLQISDFIRVDAKIIT